MKLLPLNLPKLLLALSWLCIVLLSTACSSKRTISRPSDPPSQSSTVLININTATSADLQQLPQVGPALAAKIIEHRQRHGAFRKREHLLVVDGISNRRYREIEPFVTLE